MVLGTGAKGERRATAMAMSDYVPKRWPAYTIDGEGRIREYWGEDAWLILRGRHGDERRVFKKDLPKGFVPYESLGDFDA